MVAAAVADVGDDGPGEKDAAATEGAAFATAQNPTFTPNSVRRVEG